MNEAGFAYLDATQLARGLQAGIARVLADREHLNRINVFPVPDGDTGTNLSMTMQSVLETLRAADEPHAGRLLIRLADAALDGARGNSGAILAQFLQGLADNAVDEERLSADRLTAAVVDGARYAREAINEPREGTLLTVLDDFAEALVENREGSDIAALLRAGLARAHRSLAETPLKLETLRRAGVVDAGAQGFVDLLQGICDYIVDGQAAELPPELEMQAAAAIDSSAADRHRYCTECVIGGHGIDRRRLREQLASLGSSLVIAGTTSKIRVHIHVDDPQRVFDIARAHGELRSHKADDMHRQQRPAGRTVAVVTDSACDLPEEDFERLAIHLVPMRIHFGATSYLDRVSIEPAGFYAELARRGEPPQTSQPAPGDFRRQYELLISHHVGVVSIQLTAKVSGTWQAALAAAQRVDASRIEVIDCHNASLGQGLIVRYAAECAQRGLSTREIAAAVRAIIPLTSTRALLGDLEFGVRGGRIPRWVKLLATVLRLTPVLGNRADGRIGVAGIILGRRRRLERFARLLGRDIAPDKRYRLGVGHAAAPADAERLLEMLRRIIPQLDSAFVTDVGSALGAHGGPGTLVVGLQELPAAADPQ